MSQRILPISNNSRLELRKFIIKWNNTYPVDFLWRKKYGVAFGSPEHRQMSFLDMLFDLEEDKMMKEIYDRNNKDNDESEDISKGLTDEEFDNVDITQFNKKLDNG